MENNDIEGRINYLTITASVVFYNTNMRLVENVIRCAHNSSIYKIFVVDNSPHPRLKDFVLKLSSKVEYIFGHGNVGFGAGHNIAIRRSFVENAKYHILLNPDIEFNYRVVDSLRLFMDKHLDCGLVKPALKDPKGNFMASAMLLPTPFITFALRFLPRPLIVNLLKKYELRDVNLNVVREVPNFSGSFLFLRNTVLQELGVLFDERFFMYFEDFDLVRRIHQKAKTIYYPYVTIIHSHTAEHRTNLILLMEGLRSAIRYYNKWGWIIDKERLRWNNLARNNNTVIENV